MLFPPPAPDSDPAFSLRLEVDRPLGKGRGRAAIIGGKPRIHTPAPTRNMERDIKRAAFTAIRLRGFGDALTETLPGGRVVLAGPLRALIVGVWPRPKSMKSKHPGRQWRPSAPDCDNVAKLVLDALNKCAYNDDSNVVGLHVQTVYARIEESAAIEVYLWPASAFPSE